MKIICIGRNYIDHAKEMKSKVPVEPIFFMKPDSSIVINNKPFFLPDWSNDIHHEIEIVIKINRVGKNIDKKFAHRYYDEIGLGVDFTARDIQKQCKDAGLPWEKAKAFDYSAPISKFLPLSKFKSISDINFRLDINDNTVQQGNTAEMIFSVDDLISYLSKFLTLKTGDLIFTGTPSGVGSVKIGDQLKAYIDDNKMMDFPIK